MTAGHLGKSIATLSAGLQSGAIRSADVAAETLDAIKAHPDQAIFTRLTEERARREAEKADARLRAGRSLGLLDGVLIGYKDLFDLEGIATRAGSVVLADGPAAKADAAVVTALQAAGMVTIGQLNMSEFAFSGLGINPHYGTPQNPHSRDGHRIPGGSSSGSAVAVAAGLLPVALGSDTGGSIRIPAAFNGIIGYKATRGRYSMDGVFPLATSLDALGPLCRTVQDAIWVDAAMRGRVAPDVMRVGLPDVRFVIPETVFFDGAEPEVVAAFEAAVSRLEQAGARIRRQAFPQISEIFALMAAHGAMVTAEAYALHRHRIEGPDAARMDPRVIIRAGMGKSITASGYIETLAARRRLIAEFNDAVGPGTLLLTPTLPHVAPLLAPLLTDDEVFFAINGKTLRNTLIGNFLDWCGVSMPCGTGHAGMPVGLLVSGLPGQDEPLRGVSLSVEQVLAC